MCDETHPLLDLILEGTGFYRPAAVAPRIEVNADVHRTTVTAAAQVAQPLGTWLLALSVSTRQAWAQEPGPSIIKFSFADDEIHDPGDPEIITIVDGSPVKIPVRSALPACYTNLFPPGNTPSTCSQFSGSESIEPEFAAVHA